MEGQNLDADQKRSYILRRELLIDRRLGMSILLLVKTKRENADAIIEQKNKKPPIVDLGQVDDETIERIWKMVKDREQTLGAESSAEQDPN